TTKSVIAPFGSVNGSSTTSASSIASATRMNQRASRGSRTVRRTSLTDVAKRGNPSSGRAASYHNGRMRPARPAAPTGGRRGRVGACREASTRIAPHGEPRGTAVLRDLLPRGAGAAGAVLDGGRTRPRVGRRGGGGARAGDPRGAPGARDRPARARVHRLERP